MSLNSGRSCYSVVLFFWNMLCEGIYFIDETCYRVVTRAVNSSNVIAVMGAWSAGGFVEGAADELPE